MITKNPKRQQQLHLPFGRTSNCKDAIGSLLLSLLISFTIIKVFGDCVDDGLYHNRSQEFFSASFHSCFSDASKLAE